MQGHSTPRLSAPCGFHGNRTLCPHCRLDLRSVPSNTALLGCDAIKTFHSIPPERRPSPEFSGSLIFSCLAPLLCPLPPCSGLKSLPVSRDRPAIDQALAGLVWGITFLKLYFDLEDNFLQYSVGLFHTKTPISRKYTYIPSLLNLPCNPPPHPTLDAVTGCRLSSPCDSATWDLTFKPQL